MLSFRQIVLVAATLGLSSWPSKSCAESAPGWFEHPTVGVIRPEEGTVEMDVTLLRPASELGNAYDFLFQMLPAKNIGGNTLMGLFVPAAYHPTKGLNFILRDERSTSVAHWPAFTAKKGETLRLAFSWGKEMRLFVNGRLVATAPRTAPPSPIPPRFEVRREDPFHVEGLKISSRQVPESTLAAENGKPLQRDEHTTFLADGDFHSVSTFKTPWHQETRFAGITPVWNADSRIVRAGTPVDFPFVGVNHSGTPRTFVIDHTFTESGSGAKTSQRDTWIIPPGETYQTHATSLSALKEPGHYVIETQVSSDSDTKPVVWKSAVSVLPPDAKTEGTLANYLGHHYEAGLANCGKTLRRAGLKKLRVDGFQWKFVEPEKGRFEWSETDRIVDELSSEGVEILAILGNPPTWAAEEPPQAIKDAHQNAAMPSRWKPRDLREWEDYVFAVASRYRGRVAAWEIWNEVDFHPPAKPAAFSGTTDEYLALLRAAAVQIRKADPDAKILISGFSLTPGVCDTAMPYDLLDSGAADSFDIFNTHAYNGLEFIDDLKQSLDRHKPGTPRWMTEHMWHTIANENNRMFLTAAFPLWYLEKGYDRFYTFGIYELCFDRSTQSPRPDFHVLAVLQSMLRGAETFTGRLDFPGSENFSVRHVFRLADGRSLLVLGSQTASQRITFAQEVEAAFDLWGRPLPIRQDAGSRTLDLTDLAYLVTKESPQITSTTALKAAPLCLNGGFENVLGDVSMAGLAAGRPAEWTYRDTTYDSGGKIGLARETHTGEYALQMVSSGESRVYAFQDALITKPGTYRITAWVRQEQGDKGRPYLAVYDRAADHAQTFEIDGKPTGKWEQHHFDVRFDQAPKRQVALSLGLAKGYPGKIWVDDITFEPIEDLIIPRDRALPISLGSAATHALSDPFPTTPGQAVLPLAPLRQAGTGSVVIQGVPFVQSGADETRNRSLILAGPPSHPGLSRASKPVPMNSKATRIAFLHTAMFVGAPPDTRLGEYLIRYTDGSETSVPLLHGHHLRDWFLVQEADGLAPALTMLSSSGVEYGAFVTFWDNPYPQKPIRDITVQSEDAAVLCLLAVTAETPTPLSAALLPNTTHK